MRGPGGPDHERRAASALARLPPVGTIDDTRPTARAWRRAAAAALLLLLGGCQTVDFTQRRQLVDPVMDLQEDPAEARFRSKARASREGGMAVGGRGAGGCGCY